MNQWLVVYVDLNIGTTCEWLEDEIEARQLVKERLSKQEIYEYTKGKVYLFPPGANVSIENEQSAKKEYHIYLHDGTYIGKSFYRGVQLGDKIVYEDKDYSVIAMEHNSLGVVRQPRAQKVHYSIEED